MISKELIETLTLKALTEEYFIVEVSIKKGNAIEVILDGNNGVSIQKCIDVSRNIEDSLDRETEDFELMVSSAGLGKHFKVHRQYVKNVGKEVEVVTGEGKPMSGVIVQVDDEGFDLEVKSIEKAPDSKKKVEVVNNHRVLFSLAPKVRNIISFK